MGYNFNNYSLLIGLVVLSLIDISKLNLCPLRVAEALASGHGRPLRLVDLPHQ